MSAYVLPERPVYIHKAAVIRREGIAAPVRLRVYLKLENALRIIGSMRVAALRL